MMEVPPLALDLQVRFGEELDRLPAPIAPFLPTGDPPRTPPQIRLRLAIATRVVNHRALRERGEGLQPQVYADFLAGWVERARRHLGTGKTGIPAICFSGDRHRLGRALPGATRTAPAHSNVAQFREDQGAVIQGSTVAELLIGERMVAALPLEARVAGLLAVLDAAEERLKRPVEAGQDILQDLGMD